MLVLYCCLNDNRTIVDGKTLTYATDEILRTPKNMQWYRDADQRRLSHVLTLRQLRSIRRYVPTSVFHHSLFSALVLNRLDYCNSLLIDLPLTHIQRLQSVQNTAARLIFNLRRCDHITDALIGVRWLRVPERITFKVATLTYRALHAWLRTTLLGIVIHMCRRHAAPTQAQVRLH